MSDHRPNDLPTDSQISTELNQICDTCDIEVFDGEFDNEKTDDEKTAELTGEEEIISFTRVNPEHSVPKLNTISEDISEKVIIMQFKCLSDDCEAIFKVEKKGEYEEHLATEHDIFSFRCLYQNCGKAFLSNSSLLTHIESHSGDYKCSKCDLTEPTHAAMFHHQFNYHQEGVFMCGHKDFRCLFAASTPIAILQHQATSHWPIPCPRADCNRIFRFPFQVKAHLKTHRPRPVFICRYEGCLRTCNHATTLKEHMRIHTGVKPYRCRHPDCDHTSATKSTIMKHIRKTHCPDFRVGFSKEERQKYDEKHLPEQFIEVDNELL